MPGEEENLRYGWGRWRPRCLQILNNGKGLTFFLSIHIFLHIMTANGLLSAVVPDIEKRFQLSGKDLGILAMCNEFAQLFLIGFVSYYGSYGNKAKWLACGCFVTGLGCFLFHLPHLLIENYTIEGASNSLVPNTGLCTLKNVTDDQECSASTEQQRKVHYMAIFSLGQFLIGAGSCPLYSLGQAFIDESVSPKSLPIYIGVWFGSGLIGNGIGLLLGGVFSSIFVNGTPPIGVKPGDTRWIGAWWIGYLLTGSILIVNSVFILGFPRHIPGTKERRQKAMSKGEVSKEDPLLKGGLRQFFPALLQLLKNGCFVFTTLNRALCHIVLGGIGGFLTKLLLTRYPMEPSKAGVYLFVTMMIFSVGGTLFGSFVCRQLNIKKYCKLSSLSLFAFTLLSTFCFSYFFIPGCTIRDMTGVTQLYNSSDLLKIQSISHCNQNCSCPTDQINPVCNKDGTMYLSPCHAGCHTISATNQVFGNCSCVYSKRGLGGFISKSYCQSYDNCFFMWLHLLVFGVALFFTFSGETPYRTTTLRCVPYNQRGFASGVQAAVIRVLGMLAGAIIFGSLFDFSCLLWSEKCGNRGNCMWYDVNKLFDWLGTMCIAIGVVASILGFFAFLSIKPEVPTVKEKAVDEGTEGGACVLTNYNTVEKL